jgi:hypothetical protein
VAAIKGPELAVKLVNFGANVRVLLTKGGHNFWTKAEAYNQVQWDKLQEIMQGGKVGDRGKISVYCKYHKICSCCSLLLVSCEIIYVDRSDPLTRVLSFFFSF